jgi:hypothetical protein
MASRVLPSRRTRRTRRLLALSAAWALPAAGLVVLSTSSSSSALPTQCVTSGGVNVVCTFTGPAGFGSPAIDIPAGTTSVTVHAVGRRGGNASNGTPGGNPAVVDAVVPTNGGERFFVNLRNDGGVAGTSSAGGSGGRGGGSSSVRLSTSPTPIIQAAGGGGAGNAGTGGPGTTSAGGNAGAVGAPGATNGTATASQGGQPATAAAGGSGGLGGSYSNCTTTVQLPNGADGVTGTNTVGGGAGANGAYGGGGGGGGRFGGGGGAPGASSGCGGTFASGGGGGSSIVPDGATSGVSTTESAVVTLSFSLAPRADVSTSSLAFGDVLVGTNSTEQTVTIGNSGSIPLALGSGTMTGTDPAAFVKTVDSCSNATLDVGASCQVTLLFKPTTVGTKTAVFRITDNSPTSPHDVALTGTGIAPVATLNKTSLTFNPQLVGTTSTNMGFVVKNTGAGALVIGTPTIDGANAGDFVFGPGNTCAGASLAANATCQVLVRFAPTTTGTRTASVTIPTNAAGSPSTVALSGTGIAPQADVTPTSIDFGIGTVGVSSGPQVVTLANQGTADMHVSGLSLSGAAPGDFTTSGDTCTGATVAPDASCTVSVSFKPTATGSRGASLTFATDSAVAAVVALSGVGIPPADLKILATGSVYAGRDHLVTGTVDAPGDQMVYKLGVLNEDTVAHTFRIRLTKSGSPATAEVWTSGFGAKALPTDGDGFFVTPSIGAKKVVVFTLRVTPTAPGQTISSVDADLLTDSGLLIEGVRTQTNTAAPASGTSSFDLFAKQGTQPYVGGPVDGQTTTAPALNVGQTATFTLRLKNDGTTAQQIGLKVTDMDGCAGSFTVAVKVGVKVWTTEAFAGTYLTPSLAPGKVTQATVTVKRTAAGCPSKTLRVQSLDHGTVVGTSYLLANAAYNAATD